jgi:UDPglucose 6-dehydrogenase
MNVTVIGAGYVGVPTAVTFAYLGHRVICLDTDPAKVALLRQCRAPAHEPHLDTMLGLTRPNLRFTTSYAEAVPDADVIVLAVGTPPRPDGTPDLSYLRAAARGIGGHLTRAGAVVANKSTVPPGSGNWVEAEIGAAYAARGGAVGRRCPVVSNPEFLRQGAALHESLYPDRVLLGTSDERAFTVLRELYQPILDQAFPAPACLPRPAELTSVPLVATDLASAELMKYAANAFLALKVSYINEVAELAERLGADITQVAYGLGLDPRIGGRFLQAGAGWGGSCFGKDTVGMLATAQEYGVEMALVRAAREVNYRQRTRIVEKLLGELKALHGRTVGLLGLAFKPNTDDLRDAPAVTIAQQLFERGARVRAHDPVALPRARRELAELGVAYCDSVEEAAADADALVLVTDWPHYLDLPWERLAGVMRTPLVLDGRNVLDRERLVRAGFRYLGMGR